MQENHLISIIIPIYNHAHTLERSLRTIILQTYRPLEVILVNDGSTDNFRVQSSEFRFLMDSAQIPLKIIDQENKGAAAARNRGFSESKGEYVIFWDADTVAKPEMLERLEKLLCEQPQASYAYCQFKFGWKKMKSQQFNVEDLKKYNYIDTTSLLRRADFSGFDESLNRFQDWDLWLTLAKNGKKGVLYPQVLFKKIVAGRKGYSMWFPNFLRRFPWKIKAVKEYNKAQKIILQKHQLTP